MNLHLKYSEFFRNVHTNVVPYFLLLYILISHPYLNLLDVILDSLDGVTIDIIPRIHVFSSDYFGPDYC